MKHTVQLKSIVPFTISKKVACVHLVEIVPEKEVFFFAFNASGNKKKWNKYTNVLQVLNCISLFRPGVQVSNVVSIMILWFSLVGRLEVGRGPKHSGSRHRLLPSETCIWQPLRDPSSKVDSHSTVNRRQVSLPPHLGRMMWPFYWMVSDLIHSSQWAVRDLDTKIKILACSRRTKKSKSGINRGKLTSRLGHRPSPPLESLSIFLMLDLPLYISGWYVPIFDNKYLRKLHTTIISPRHKLLKPCPPLHIIRLVL